MSAKQKKDGSVSSNKSSKESKKTEETSERAVQLKLNVIGAFQVALYPLGMKPEPTENPVVDEKPTKLNNNGRSQSQQQMRTKGKEELPKRATKSSVPLKKRGGVVSNSDDAGSVQAEGEGQRKLSSRRRRRRAVSSAAYSLDQSEGETIEEEEPPKPKQAWDQFSEHIKTFDMTTNFVSSDNPILQKTMNSLLNDSGSDICKKILKDMKDQVEKKKAKELLALQKALEAEASAQQCQQEEEEEESEDESEDEEELERRRRKEEALRYWGIIRRDVQERIRIRKEKNPAGGTWNALRSQLRAMTRADNVRKELYEKYGIIPKDGTRLPEDSMKPKLSIDVKEVVSRFNSYQIRKLRVTFS